MALVGCRVSPKPHRACTCCALKEASDSSSMGRRSAVIIMRHTRPGSVTAALPTLTVGACVGCNLARHHPSPPQHDSRLC